MVICENKMTILRKLRTANNLQIDTLISLMTTRERFTHILHWFAENAPSAESELHYSNPFELLVAVMLSAQCTDKRVNLVTPALFAAFPTPAKMAEASVDSIFALIRSVSYPNAKAQHLQAMARRLVEVYDGKVPDTIEKLQTLSGVGRKTANVVCAVIWNQPTMAVDTHIFRISERLGLTHHSKNVRQTEDTLMRYIPAELIPKAHHWLLLHGRYICQARTPHCDRCGLTPWCRKYQEDSSKKE